MKLSANIHSNVPVYIQIENQIRFAIASGEITSGDQLPSVKDLSEMLKVNPNTVAKAYRDLEVMGLLYTRRGVGAFVSKGVQAKCRESCRKEVVKRMFEVVREGTACGMNKKDLTRILNASFGVEETPYEEAPKAVLSLAGK